jgi:hypothetical protein
MRTLQIMNKKMFCLVKKQDFNHRPPHEVGMHFVDYGVLHVNNLDTFVSFE